MLLEKALIVNMWEVRKQNCMLQSLSLAGDLGDLPEGKIGPDPVSLSLVLPHSTVPDLAVCSISAGSSVAVG